MFVQPIILPRRPLYSRAMKDVFCAVSSVRSKKDTVGCCCCDYLFLFVNLLDYFKCAFIICSGANSGPGTLHGWLGAQGARQHTKYAFNLTINTKRCIQSR